MLNDLFIIKHMTREQIIEELKTGIKKFSFTKTDGTIREAKGTRNIDIITEENALPKGIVKDNDTIIKYYDVDKGGWRSFKVDNFIEFL